MAHDTQLVAIEIAHIGPVLVRMIVLADARGPSSVAPAASAAA